MISLVSSIQTNAPNVKPNPLTADFLDGILKNDEIDLATAATCIIGFNCIGGHTMDLMGILTVVLSGVTIVLLALTMIMVVTMIMGKIIAFAQTFKKVSAAKKAAEKSAA